MSTTQALHVNAFRAQVNTFARVPSTLRTLRSGIVAAENIRGTLSDAHTDFLRAFVSAEGTNGKSISDYRAAIELANDYLVAASQNIAYVDAERQPILRALDNLSLYQTLEGSALADGGNIYDIRAADDVIREHIIPAVDDLAAVNFAHLDNAYSGGRAAARIWLMAFCAASIALVLLLLYTQRYLLATFRRVINPWIAAGTVALVLCAIAFGVCGTNFLSNIRIAKEDAFDSVFALSQAKALAYNAHSQESIYLLTRDKDEKASDCSTRSWTISPSTAKNRLRAPPFQHGSTTPGSITGFGISSRLGNTATQSHSTWAQPRRSPKEHSSDSWRR